ncbi:chromosome partitioning protein ParB, partial [Xanthomonas citri pv. citri]|nr:chromosome partitioning protein ParB [Xanthomonas citri pv. citri]
NVRKVVRDKLQDAKPAAKEKGGKAGSRMREPEPATPEVDPRQQGMFDHEKQGKPAQLDPEAAQLVAFAAKQAETLCAEVSALSKMLQQRPDVVSALGDALQSVVHAQTELFRTRHALAVLAKPE